MENKQIYYKGFDKDLSCRGFKYNFEDTFKHDGRIYLCNKGFHFCYELKQCFEYYSNNGSNRFCIVEPLGEVLKGSDKLVTNEIRIIRELSKEEIDEILKQEEKNERIKEMGLDVLQELQSSYNIFFAGSSALFLYGLDLGRKAGDIDVIMPYYQKIKPTEDGLIEECEEFDAKSSGNDFSYTCAITTEDGRFFKIDIRINNEQSYDEVLFEGKTYKLSKLQDIIEAKARYWKEGNKKHGDDLKFLMGLKKTNKNIIDDLFN